MYQRTKKNFLFLMIGCTVCGSVLQAANLAGNVENETMVRLQPPAFSKVHSSVVANITYQLGATYSLVMEGKMELVENIKVESENGTLLLKPVKEKKNNNEPAVEIQITAPYLEEYVHTAVGNLTLSGNQENTDLSIRLQGVSSVTLHNLKTRSFSYKGSGVGNLKWNNLSCNTFEIQNSGVGNVDGKRLECNSVKISFSGVGQVEMDQIKCRTFECNRSGVGNVKLHNVNSEVLKIRSSGHGKVSANGKVNTLDVDEKTRKRADLSGLKVRKK